MGFFDFGSKVILTYAADISDAKAKLKELSGAERKAAEESIKAMEAKNKKLQDQAKHWQFVGQAVATTAAVYGVASRGLDAYAKTSAQAQREVSDMQTKASAAFDGVMASIGKVVVGLEPLISGVLGVVNAFNELGLAGPVAIGALGLAITGNPAIAAILAAAAAMSGDQDPEVGRAVAVRMGLIPGQAAGAAASKVGGSILTDPWSSSAVNGLKDDAAQVGKVASLLLKSVFSEIEMTEMNIGAEIDKRNAAMKAKWAEYMALRKQIFDGEKKFKPGSNNADWAIEQSLRAEERQRMDDDEARADYLSPNLGADTAAYDKKISDGNEILRQANESSLKAYELLQSKQKSLMESLFGSPSEIDAIGMASRGAFDAFTAGATAGYTALVTGQESFGSAVKRATGDALLAVGQQALVEALKETAFGVASLAIPGGQVAAAAHFQAAGMFAGVAVAAGVGAHALGAGASAGGSSAGAGATKAPSTIGSSGASGGGPIIVYGDAFAEDSPRMRALASQKLVARALGNSSVRYG